MTYDAQVSTDVEGALIDLRDKVDGMSDFEAVQDNIGNNLEDRDTVVWTVGEEAPNGDDEAVELRYETHQHHHINFALGTWDGDEFDENTDKGSPACDLVDNDNDLEKDDSVEYWLQYDNEDGFVFYIRRTEGDGNNDSLWFAYEKLDKIWDYQDADFDESHGAIFMTGNQTHNQENTNNWKMFNSSSSEFEPQGVLNPDNNFDNYLVKEGLVEEDQVETDAGQSPWIGHISLAVTERSGGDVQSQDTVTDGGSDIYEVLKFEDPDTELLIRAD